MKEESELDFKLKIRLMRFLWYNGYYVKRNLELINFDYNSPRSTQFTDIDVFGLKIDAGLKQNKIICDCKSGARVSTTERLFWLSGVMKYFGAERGFFIRRKLNEAKYVEIGEKLSITPLSEDQLSKLELSYSISSKPFIGSFNEDIIDKSSEIFSKLKTEAPLIHEYLRSKYWFDPIQGQIATLILAENRINKLTNLNEEDCIFLQTYILSLLSLSIMQFSEPLLIISNDQRENYIYETILGGRIESMERKKLLARFYDFMSKEISTRYNQNYPVSRNEFLNFIYPSYLKYLIDIIERICLNPLAAIHVPRILDIIAFETILNNNNKLDEIFEFKEKDMAEGLKLAKDFFLFGHRAGFISDANMDLIKSKIFDIS